MKNLQIMKVYLKKMKHYKLYIYYINLSIKKCINIEKKNIKKLNFYLNKF
jgi:hypothetical protein